ncbi:DUF6416 domain-containing protein [Paractinoplanes lichenicola]|uniref:Uncharacterized protein n=1 Tax=Paractinoplanes lichenicola TaxID=2802976 RepID=A0ABS1VXY6_9ACTN|nr:DUF6416 domain-containing protein [Actinoplanes lichenicola]MBL7259361.1 hypothetical protein [Actinoplanes lichenicola]
MSLRSRQLAAQRIKPGRPRPYTVFGLVTADAAGRSQLLVAGVAEGFVGWVDTTEFSGDGRYERFAHQVRALSVEAAEADAHAYVAAQQAGPEFTAWQPADQELYNEVVYRRLTPRARAIFAVLAAQPGTPFSGERLAALTGMKNLNSVAGSLSWPRTYCGEAGRIQCWWFTDGARTEYSFDVVHAELFLTAAGARLALAA